MPAPKDYKHIRAWGEYMGSFEYYIKQQQEKAAEDNAPIDAIYEREGRWFRFSEVVNENTKHFVQQILDKMK